MLKWFRSCKTAEEGKHLYRELLKKYHPDNCGENDTIKEINNEYTMWWESHKNIHRSKETNKFYEETENPTKETAEEFIEIMWIISEMQGVEIEATGLWLWASGNTYTYREELKELGFRWSASKKLWYWAKDLDDRFRHRGHSMSRNRAVYGSEKLKKEEKTYVSD